MNVQPTLHTWRSSTSTIWDGIYRYDLADDARQLPQALPMLMIHGDRDTTAPLAGAQQLAAHHPAAVLVTLPGVDHHPLLRDPSRCVEAIRSFSATGVSHMLDTPVVAAALAAS